MDKVEALKQEILRQMEFVLRHFDNSGFSNDRREAYSKELEALAKAYAALEGKNVTL